MKKRFILLFLGMISLLGVAVLPVHAISTTTVSSIYRLYNLNSGEHMYTLNSYERDNLKKHGWHYEGLGWQVPDNVGAPVYRLYNPNSGEHFYTVNSSERDRAKHAGWRYEGISWHSAGGIEIFRVFNPNTKGPGSHHYTSNPKERDQLIHSGWRYEGVAFYGGDGVRISTNE